MAWSPSLHAIGWLLSLELSAFFWDTWTIFEQTQADLTQVLRTWSIQICVYLELDFVPPIFGPLKIRSNGFSLQGWAGLWLFYLLGDLRLSDMYLWFLRKYKLSLCITLISQTELITRYLTRLGWFVFLNVIYKINK